MKEDLRQPTLPTMLQQNSRMGNGRNSFTKTPTLNCQPRIPDLWRGQSPLRLNRAETAATIASSTYSPSSTMPPPHVGPYAHYPPPRPQHSTHSSYDSVTALLPRLLRTHTQTPRTPLQLTTPLAVDPKSHPEINNTLRLTTKH